MSEQTLVMEQLPLVVRGSGYDHSIEYVFIRLNALFVSQVRRINIGLKIGADQFLIGNGNGEELTDAAILCILVGLYVSHRTAQMHSLRWLQALGSAYSSPSVEMKNRVKRVHVDSERTGWNADRSTPQ